MYIKVKGYVCSVEFENRKTNPGYFETARCLTAASFTTNLYIVFQNVRKP